MSLKDTKHNIHREREREKERVKERLELERKGEKRLKQQRETNCLFD